MDPFCPGNILFRHAKNKVSVNPFGLFVRQAGNSSVKFLLRTPLKKCSLTADDGASSPAEWCTHFGEMVHGGRGRGAPGHHAGNYSGMPLRLRMDSPSIWMV